MRSRPRSDVKAMMVELAPNFPKGLEYRIIYNPTEFIEVSIKALMMTILEAIALVVLVIIVFLQTWRATLGPAARDSDLADRHLRRHAGARLLDQLAHPVRARALCRHRRR